MVYCPACRSKNRFDFFEDKKIPPVSYLADKIIKLGKASFKASDFKKKGVPSNILNLSSFRMVVSKEIKIYKYPSELSKLRSRFAKVFPQGQPLPFKKNLSKMSSDLKDLKVFASLSFQFPIMVKKLQTSIEKVNALWSKCKKKGITSNDEIASKLIGEIGHSVSCASKCILSGVFSPLAFFAKHLDALENVAPGLSKAANYVKLIKDIGDLLKAVSNISQEYLAFSSYRRKINHRKLHTDTLTLLEKTGLLFSRIAKIANIPEISSILLVVHLGIVYIRIYKNWDLVS